MLGFLFGFNARLGRMHYFLGTIAVAVVTTAVFFMIVSYTAQHLPGGVRSSADVITSPGIIVIAVFSWITFTLQCMRIRDIGWDPVCVIPAWIALLIVDKLVASKIPAWSLGHEHHGTIVGSLINFALILALTFWPGGDYEGPPPTFGERRRTPDRPSPRPRATSVAAARLARMTGADSAGR